MTEKERQKQARSRQTLEALRAQGSNIFIKSKFLRFNLVFF
jgi:hypothetical protein